MNDVAYNLGRLLACANKLHLLYCQVVRRKKDGSSDVPPELLGSALLQAAYSNPASALARLGERMLPYQKWAETFPERSHLEPAVQEKVGLVKYYHRFFEEFGQKIPREQLSKPFNDTDRAELLLGFLAKFESKKDKEQAEERT